MTSHILIRDRKNQPICACGYRPDILNQTSPVGIQWKAKADVLNHVDEMRKLETQDTPQRSPEAPFRSRHAVRHPRAGVRQTEDGGWLLTLWDGDDIVHVIDQRDREHTDRYTAFTQGWLTVGACWNAGTNLNGMASV